MDGTGFAARLRALREQAGLTQKELADRAGLVKSAIGHLEQGLREPTWGTVLALGKALGVRSTAFEPEGEGSALPAPPRRPGRPRKAAEGGAEETATAARKAGRKRKR
jgi:transcriptional regulator with XRE-family HTH domain